MFIRIGVDQTVYRTADLVKASCPSFERGGYIWYDVTDQGLSAELTLLRQAGVIAHHPVVHTLIRFEERRERG